MIRIVALAFLLVCNGCEKPVEPPTVDQEPIEEAREFLISWIEEVGPEQFIARGEGYKSYLPLDQWEIGIDGKWDENSGTFEFGVYYPYRDEESGRALMDLLGAVVKKERGEWSIVEVFE